MVFRGFFVLLRIFEGEKIKGEIDNIYGFRVVMKIL